MPVVYFGDETLVPNDQFLGVLLALFDLVIPIFLNIL
jgi:hypothetical protein